MAKQPNILLILTDQQATHTFSCYGGPVARSPEVDRLAEDGIRYNRAYTPCALCTPARASLLTGLYPHNHGALFNTGVTFRFREEEIGRGLTTYPEILQKAGYRLKYSGKWHAGIAQTAEAMGFEGFSLEGYGGIRTDPGYLEHRAKMGQGHAEQHVEFVAEGTSPEASGGNYSGWISGTVESAPCHFVVDRALDQINSLSRVNEPWMMAVNFWEPHAPYLPTEDYKDRYSPEMIKEWPNFRDPLHNRPALHRILRDAIFPGARDASWEQWAQAICRYYAQAAMVDFEVGRILNAMKDRGLYDDCLIVFASDHGESIGVHGGAFDKGGMAYEEIYRIPLIVKLPGNESRGETRQSLVSLFDLAPTFCEAAGSTMEGIDARSLYPVIRNGDAAGRESLLSEDHGHRVPFGQRILWNQRYKYVWNLSDVDELYDLEKDPAELDNRIDDPGLKTVREALCGRMLEAVRSNGDLLGPQVTQMLE